MAPYWRNVHVLLLLLLNFLWSVAHVLVGMTGHSVVSRLFPICH